jgi:hypothetical protein
MRLIAAGIVGFALLLVGAAMFIDATTMRQIQCDGSLPRWMLYAQDYDGGGCAHVLPSSQAAPNADWTLYCMGMCAGNPEPWPPRD